MSGDCVDNAMRRVSEWLDKSCTHSIREPLRVVENCQSHTVNLDAEREQVSKSQKRKRAPELASTMSQTPSPKKRGLPVGLGEPPLAQSELFQLTRYVID